MKNPWFAPILVLTVMLTALSLVAVFLHHHDAADEEHGCSVCRLVQAFTGILIAIYAALLLTPPLGRRFSLVLENRFFSRLFASSLRGRAPPFLSLQ